MLRCTDGRETELVGKIFKDSIAKQSKHWNKLLIANLIYLIILGADFTKDQDQLTNILTQTIQSVRRIVKKKKEDFELIIFWFANMMSLMNCLKQYSGDLEYTDAFSRMNYENYCLQNYDVSRFWSVFDGLNILIFNRIIEIIREKKLRTFIVIGALLEFEPIASLSCPSAVKSEGLKVSNLMEKNTWKTRRSHHQRFFEILDEIHAALSNFGVDQSTMMQSFCQLLFYISATFLNAILTRSDLCNWASGAQIRCNISKLETWLSEKELIYDQVDISNTSTIESLSEEKYSCDQNMRNLIKPMVEICHLLQSKKCSPDESIVEAICLKSNHLTTGQIVKLLSMFTPVDDYEPRVSPLFLHAIEMRLETVRSNSARIVFGDLDLDEHTLLVDANHIMPFQPIFSHCPTQFDSFHIPDELNIIDLIILPQHITCSKE